MTVRKPMQKEIGSVVTKLLTRCNITPVVTKIDKEFTQLCMDDAAAHGCPMEDSPGIRSFRPWNISGVAIAYVSYGHLESLATKMYIALYTSLAVYIEDVYTDRPDLTNSFNQNFIMRQPQKTAVLQALDQCLRETSNYFDTVQTNLIISSTLNFVTSIGVEHEITKMQMTTSSDNFADFLRGLSGISCSYAIFIFPKGVSVNTYIQALPSMSHYINHTNDVLSFYKEELNGEDNNYISVLAKHRSARKVDVLEQLADLTAQSHSAVGNILSSCKVAHDAWHAFARGYVGFHTSYARYKLDQLIEMGVAED